MRIPDETGHLGRYDEISEKVLRELGPEKVHTVILLVHSHNPKQSGFSVSTVLGHAAVATLPASLRDLADQIEAQVRQSKNS